MTNDQFGICEDCRQTTSGHCSRHPLVYAAGWPVSSAIPGSAPVTRPSVRLVLNDLDALSDADLDALAERLAPRIENRLRELARQRGDR